MNIGIVGREQRRIPDNKVHGANMRPNWVLSAPDGPHVGPMNLAIRDAMLIRHVAHHNGDNFRITMPVKFEHLC